MRSKVRQAADTKRVSGMKKPAVPLALAAPFRAGGTAVTGAGEDITGGARLAGDAISG